MGILSDEQIQEIVDQGFEKYGEELRDIKAVNTPLKFFLYEEKYQKYKGKVIWVDGVALNDKEVMETYPELAFLNIRMVDRKYCVRNKISFPCLPHDILTEIERFVEDLENEARKGKDLNESTRFAIKFGSSICRKAAYGEEQPYALPDTVLTDTLNWFIGAYDEDLHKNNEEYIAKATIHLYTEGRLRLSLQRIPTQ